MRHGGAAGAGCVRASMAPWPTISRSSNAARNSSGNALAQRSCSSTASEPSGRRTTHCGWSTCAGTRTGSIATTSGAADTALAARGATSGGIRLWKCVGACAAQAASASTHATAATRSGARARLPDIGRSDGMVVVCSSA
jgi:hypothetical protein